MKYIEAPSKSAVDRLKRKGCSFTSNELKQELQRQISALGIPAGIVTTNAAVVAKNLPDTDPQTLYIKYPSLYTPSSYIADVVKVEASVRSLRTPYATVAIHSLLNEHNPNPVYGETLFNVDAVEPRKTFLEKAFLLHEEFSKPDRSKIKSERMSRHLYDLGNIMKTPFGQEALKDDNLYDYIVRHRESYNRISWVDYKSLKRSSLSFIPPADIIDVYRQDYNHMQEQMIYGDTIPFDDLIEQLKKLQDDFRKPQ